MISITKWPVIVLGNYRSGSTVLATHLGKENNVPYFLEPWAETKNRHDRYGDHVYGLKENFYHFYKSGRSDFIIKFMPNQISRVTPYRQLLEGQGFKIKLYRDNEIDSIVSYYVAEERKKWWTYPGEVIEDYSLEIKEKTILGSIEAITRNNFLLDKLDYDYDLVVSYESLGLIPPRDYVKTTMPNNIEDIRRSIVEVYNKLYR